MHSRNAQLAYLSFGLKGACMLQALMVLVPEAYRNHPDLQKDYPEVCPAFLTPSSMRSFII